MVHVYPDSVELGRIYQADLLINATMPEFAAAVAALKPIQTPGWLEWGHLLRQTYETHLQPPPSSAAVNLAEIVSYLSRHLPPGAIVTTGAGNYTAWVHRFFQFSSPRTQLGPISGAMGYGVPAAVAAKVLHPERVVISFSGDGCFLMNGQELATAVQYGLPVIFIVVNNGMLGTIRMHQERHFPGRVYATALTNPNFADYACAFGATGAVVERTGDFAPAFEQALQADRPALIELRVDPAEIMPGQWLE
jgi:acetolactate synthase-1/2/3 large subunit